MSMKLGAASGTYNVQATESAKVSIRPSYKTVRCITHFLDGAEASFDIDVRYWHWFFVSNEVLYYFCLACLEISYIHLHS